MAGAAERAGVRPGVGVGLELAERAADRLDDPEDGVREKEEGARTMTLVIGGPLNVDRDLERLPFALRMFRSSGAENWNTVAPVDRTTVMNLRFEKRDGQVIHVDVSYGSMQEDLTAGNMGRR